MLASFLVVSAIYRCDIDAAGKKLYWDGMSFYIAIVLLDYFMNLLAFGYEPKKRNYLIFDTCICLYLIIGYSLRQSSIL